MPTQKSSAVFATQTSRREVLKKEVYVTPLILTFPALPAFTAKGSEDINNKDKKDKKISDSGYK